jgi:flagellar protein FlaJ
MPLFGQKSTSKDELFKIPYFRQVSLRIFGKFLGHRFQNGNTDLNLKRSKLGMSRVEFYSQTAMILTIAVAVGIVFNIIFAFKFPHLVFLAGSITFLLLVAVLAIVLETPVTVTRTRRRRINSMLTIASGFFATMSSADIPIDIIMKDLGESRQYGEISREARIIWIRSELFGMDIISSIKESIHTSASQKFAEFLQGIVTSVNSGGDLKQYFISKANQYQGELSTLIKQNSNSMGILAESFVTVAVAFPLILLIIVGVVAFLSPSSPTGLIDIMILTVALIIPVILALFGYFFSSTMGEIEL